MISYNFWILVVCLTVIFGFLRCAYNFRILVFLQFSDSWTTVLSHVFPKTNFSLNSFSSASFCCSLFISSLWKIFHRNFLLQMSVKTSIYSDFAFQMKRHVFWEQADLNDYCLGQLGYQIIFSNLKNQFLTNYREFQGKYRLIRKRKKSSLRWSKSHWENMPPLFHHWIIFINHRIIVSSCRTSMSSCRRSLSSW